MKIRSIEIVGFKSFPERMKVAFPEGISAVVGPNGCGKSNIVDAIRWVMGEQSARGLRGSQMEDVLFNGARSHQPSGLAEASLTLSNENGYVRGSALGPSEITITRRLFRSGDSEYLINNVPCRLKDIAQFLMDTGLGTRAYSVIEQGRIGSLVDSRPEERRALIDEAAGITLYKHQKREAERKIESTEQNLLHIQTLMNETKRQYNNLSKASKKAAQYKVLKAEYQELDLGLAFQSLTDLNQRHVLLSSGQDELKAHLTGFQSAVEKLEVQVEESRLSILEREKEVESRSEHYYSLKNEFNSLTQERDFIRGQVAANRSRHQKLTEELARLQEQKAGRTREIGSFHDEEAGLSAELEDLSRRQNEVRLGFQELNQRYEAEVAVRDRLRRDLVEANNKSARLEEQIAANDRLAVGQSARRDEILEEVESLRGELVRLDEIIHDLSGQFDRLDADRAEAESGLAEKKEELSDVNAEDKHIDGLAREKESAYAAADSRLTALRDMQAGFEWYPDNVRILMKSPELKAAGILGPAAEYIKAPAGYEAALEAGLGERLRFIVAKDRRVVLEAMRFLEKSGAGRCGFISLADLGAGDEKNLLAALLGPYETAENWDEAMRLWPERTVLTRDGYFFRQGGVIIGGKTSREETGLLARRQEVQDLADRVSALSAEKENLLGQLKIYRENIEQVKVEVEGKEVILKKAVSQVVDTEKKLSAADIRREELESRREALAEALKKQEAAENKLTADQGQAVRESGRLKGLSLELSRSLAQAEQGVNLFAGQVTESREELQRVSLQVNTVSGRIKGLKQNLARLEEWLQETANQLKVREQDLAKAREEEKRLLNRREEIAVLLNGLEDRIIEAEKEAAGARSQVDSLRERLNVQETEARTARRAREEKGEEIRKIELDLQEITLTRRTLLDRILSEYGLNLAELPDNRRPDPGKFPDSVQARERLDELKAQIEGLGEVNLSAISEEEALKERYDFYKNQYDDLVQSIENLRESMVRINRTCNLRFNKVFKAVDEKLREIFPLLFDGGEAWLTLTDENDPLESGVEIQVHPPGKKLTVMSLLSGGEKALVALALIFALYLIKPSPFCLLDEIDAPLDEANIDRFNKLLKKLGQSSQIILVTHNKRTMQMAQTLYGVTMEEPGVSKMVSVSLADFEDEADEKLVQAI